MSMDEDVAGLPAFDTTASIWDFVEAVTGPALAMTASTVAPWRR
jgi:hypothetical protein